jgi:hypothetical protein
MVCGTLVDPPLHQSKGSTGSDKKLSALKIHNGRPFKRYVMAELIADTLEVIEARGGEEGLREIRRYLPAWGIGGTRLRTPPTDGNPSMSIRM